MKILPKSARELKSNFYGKSGWTLHSMLVYTKFDNDLEIQAFDHWCSDTVQDAWFTASCFEVVFDTLEKKPKRIRILSDNGAHYHCSELMAIVAKWNTWYDIDVRSWTFLEAGEAKTTIDSHHAQVNNNNDK